MSAEIKLAKKKKRSQNIAFGLFTLTSYAIVALLFVILAFIVIKGIGVISWEFISEMPKNGMTEGGIFPAIVGTLCLVLVSMVFAFPVGVLAAIYMNEYVRDGILKKIIKQMTNNLAGVPSIVFGLFGMSLFVNKMGFGDSILAGGLTLGLLVLPIVIRTTEESLKAVDDTFRQASLGLGASKWETTSKVVFPIAFPNVITGLILSIGRVSGETAPILFTVAAYFLPKLPTSIFDQAMALPYHLYVISTSGTNIEASRAMAYGTALVLIIIVLISNLLANALRKYYGKKVKMN
ncbi:phosphate ABC transporter permease PstA [Flavobacterium frigidarium]|jgi:phosphate transport system permease protein|uniref:phosphate ABC transporter permease PstA n=1 Tax=Flavobacterium frigidarium TaxID=99286 RepID=UPI001DD8116E|nr:phosphate ABC transporter permease PstA [Bacteroidota bacterium]|tara:strand:+ start:13511 stop:14389 length:879 start_codon:yes stop_codon:yes gene_type:complete